MELRVYTWFFINYYNQAWDRQIVKYSQNENVFKFQIVSISQSFCTLCLLGNVKNNVQIQIPSKTLYIYNRKFEFYAKNVNATSRVTKIVVSNRTLWRI